MATNINEAKIDFISKAVENAILKRAKELFPIVIDEYKNKLEEEFPSIIAEILIEVKLNKELEGFTDRMTFNIIKKEI